MVAAAARKGRLQQLFHFNVPYKSLQMSGCACLHQRCSLKHKQPFHAERQQPRGGAVPTTLQYGFV